MLIRELLGEDLDRNISPGVPKSLVASDRFIKEWPTYKSVPGFKKSVSDFVNHYQSGGSAPYDIKDETFVSNKDIKSIQPTLWHWHATHGKIIIVYQNTTSQLRLLALGPHDMIEDRRLNNLADNIRKMNPETFTHWRPEDEVKKNPYKPPVVPRRSRLSDSELTDLIQMLEMLCHSPTDRPDVEKMAAGTMGNFLQWARLALGVEAHDQGLDQLIIDRLGGKKSMMDLARRFLGTES